MPRPDERLPPAPQQQRQRHSQGVPAPVLPTDASTVLLPFAYGGRERFTNSVGIFPVNYEFLVIYHDNLPSFTVIYGELG